MASSETTTKNTPLTEDFDSPSREEWLALVDKALKGGDFEKRLVSRTADGVSIAPLYTRDDELKNTLSACPGSAPFTRGLHQSVQGAGWDIRQLHTGPEPETTNKAILADLNAGVSSVTIQMESPGQFGIPTGIDALKTVLKDVRLDWAPIAFAPGMNFSKLLKDLHTLICERDFPKQKINIALNADPLGELARTGTLPGSVNDLFKQLGKDIRFAKEYYPHMRVLLVDARPYHEAGATQGQELAALCATLIANLRNLEQDGLTAPETFSCTAFALTAEADIFLTIAKLRAARRLIAKIAEVTGAPDTVSKLHITSVTSQRMMTRRDPWTNLLRTTTACAAAALGGADAITVLPFTWALGRPDDFVLRTARNIQLVCQEESYLGRVIDPAGGSWYVEKLTDELAKKAWALFQEIEAQGGLEAALASSSLQDRIAKAADERAARVATGKEPLTGTSTFPFLADDGITAKPHPDALPLTSKPIINCPLTPHRLAEPFETLRDRADAFKEKTGALPKVFLASMGSVAEHTGRSTWMKNLLAAGGIEAITHSGFKEPDEAARAFQKSGTAIACICSSDALYEKLAVSTLKALKAAGATRVYLAGRPGDLDNDLKSSGLSGYLYAGQNTITELSKLQEALNMAP